ncbi:MAG TPA: hypothetical protein VHL09_05730 [Dehalococcoidia bacterium]|nr:hypothetical protein [Dehalococcoidia bacterium]
MTSARPECALCGRPTPDLCAGCGLPVGRDHGAPVCPRCGRRSPDRSRWIPDLIPTGRPLGLILLTLIGGALAVIAAQVCWPIGA